MKKYQTPHNTNAGTQKNLRGLIKGLIIGEFALVGVVGYFWHQLHYNQDYRQRWSKDHPALLEAYYKFMSGYHGNAQREIDSKAWGQQSSASASS